MPSEHWKFSPSPPPPPTTPNTIKFYGNIENFIIHKNLKVIWEKKQLQQQKKTLGVATFFSTNSPPQHHHSLYTSLCSLWVSPILIYRPCKITFRKSLPPTSLQSPHLNLLPSSCSSDYWEEGHNNDSLWRPRRRLDPLDEFFEDNFLSFLPLGCFDNWAARRFCFFKSTRSERRTES